MIIKFIPVKVITLFIVSALLLSCNYSNSKRFEDLHTKIATHLSSIDTGERVIFIVTEYDCSICIQSIHEWIKDIEKDSIKPKITGILFSNQNLRDSGEIVKKLKLPAKVDWKMTSETDLFDFLANEFPDMSSPYAIKFSNNKIEYVKSINKNFYFPS